MFISAPFYKLIECSIDAGVYTQGSSEIAESTGELQAMEVSTCDVWIKASRTIACQEAERKHGTQTATKVLLWLKNVFEQQEEVFKIDFTLEKV